MTKSIYNKQNGRFEDEEANAGGAGTVTSVGLSVPSIFSIFGSPITSSGTLGFTLASQSANRFLASPNGSAGLPTFRAISLDDISFSVPGTLSFVAGTTVTGSAVSSVQFAGLTALAQGETWLLKAAIYNPTGSTSTYYLEYNADTILTNYYAQTLSASSTSVAGARNNNARGADLVTAAYSIVSAEIRLGVDNKPRALITENRDSAAAIVWKAFAHIWNTATPPTSIEIVSSVASAIGIGSIFKLYKIAGS